MSASDFKDFCHSFVSVIKSTCDGCVYVFGPPGPDSKIIFQNLIISSFFSTTIIWNKMFHRRGKYQNKYEPCWFGWAKTGEKFIDDRTLTNVWDFKRPYS
ncbi:MAG: hypothetical protein CM15mV65_410 [Caudoviricetes sp.]|nr:MAG: hypothetical protein CM15mV65_410 [Caudoviricetes sp.]